MYPNPDLLIEYPLPLVACGRCLQIFDRNNTGPLYRLSSTSLDRIHWHRHERLRAFMYPLDAYIHSNRWNMIDIGIIVVSILSFSLRYTLPLRLFQIDRVCFAFAIIVCYFRLLRFWFVLPTIGPRIIAIEMMVIYTLRTRSKPVSTRLWPLLSYEPLSWQNRNLVIKFTYKLVHFRNRLGRH